MPERYEINIKIKSCPICSCAMYSLGDGQVLKCFHCGSAFRMVDFSMDDRHMIFERIGESDDERGQNTANDG